MWVVAFIALCPVIRETLGQLGEPISAPSPAPAHDPPLLELALPGQIERELDPQALPTVAGPEVSGDLAARTSAVFSGILD